MNNYYRITVYHKAENISAIFDSFGHYDKLWQFSSHFVGRDFEVIEVSNSDTFLDGNISKIEYDTDNIYLRAVLDCSRPENIIHTINGKSYHAIRVGERVYIPNKTKTV